MQPCNTLHCLREKERETRKTMIIDAARTLFDQNGYNGVSMAEIAQVANIGKSTIYTYFDSQEALYLEVASRDTRRFIGELKTMLSQCESNPIASVINFFIENYCRHKQRFQMILNLTLAGGITQKSRYDFQSQCRELLELLDGIFRLNHYPEDTRFMTHTLLSLLNGMFISFQNYSPSRYEDPERKMKKIGAKIAKMFRGLKTDQTKFD